jgi:TRAP-type C4-dicarboxylate transport system substrate-binding protein
MNPDVYNGLPDDLRAVIDANSGLMASAWAGRAMDEGDEIAEVAITERGNTIVTLGDDVVAELRDVGDQVIAAWIEEMNGLGLDGQQLFDDATAAVARHSGAAN